MNRLVFIIWLGIEFLDMDPRALKIFKDGLFMAHLMSKCLKLERFRLSWKIMGKVGNK